MTFTNYQGLGWLEIAPATVPDNHLGCCSVPLDPVMVTAAHHLLPKFLLVSGFKICKQRYFKPWLHHIVRHARSMRDREELVHVHQQNQGLSALALLWMHISARLCLG